MADETTMEPVAPEFWVGVAQFNQGQFYACHDTLEAIWMEAIEPQRSLYQGILQLAVALYHLSNQNLRGAIILLGEGSRRLNGYAPNYAGVDIAGLLTQSTALLATLQQVQLQHTQGSLSQPGEQPPQSPEIPAVALPIITMVDSDTTPMPR